MIKITYELYGNDYTRQERLTKTFDNLEEVQDWIIKNYYYHEWYSMGRTVHSDIFYGESSINFPSQTLNFAQNAFRFIDVWIHTIEEDGEIIYSGGKYTQGIKHISKAMREKFEEWKQEDKEDPKHLKRLGFKFKD